MKWDRGSLLARISVYSTLSQTTNFRLFQNEECADDNSEFDENGEKFSKRVENTVGKGEIDRQKTCIANR